MFRMVLQETYAIEDCFTVPKLDGTEQKYQITGTTTIANGEMTGGTGYLLPAWSNTGNWELTYEFKGSNNNCASTIIKGDETNENNNQILIHTSEIAVSTNGSTTRISGLPSSYNTWHSVTVVKNGSDITVTMDNVTKTFTWSLATTLSSLAIGVQVWGGVPTIRKIKVKAL